MGDTNIYFAGGMYGDGKSGYRFLMVSTSPNKRPYLTHRYDGLQATSHHASLYRLSDDGDYAILVDHRNGGNAPSPRRVKLSDEHKTLIQKSIELDYFFDN